MNYYLAVDIGASSGRHILGYVRCGKLCLSEIYRFENNVQNQNGSLVWDIEHLKNEVINGIAECKKIGKIPCSVAIDTWAVDYVLLDENKNILPPVYAYRDSRTAAVKPVVDALFQQGELYGITGIQSQNFNTIYQLYCDKQSGKLQKAKHFLMIPEFLSYCLTGKMANEYTNASTTSMLNAKTKTWDAGIIEKLGFNKDLFLPLSTPGTLLGGFTAEIEKQVGFNANVVLAPSHDTASAVAACPIDGESVYISSGTWSLIGTENAEPILNNAARSANFTNEGGVEYKFRFLKNIMGMWLFQNIRRNINKSLTYDEMMFKAQESSFSELINPNDDSFVAPENMVEAVRKYLNKSDLPLADVLKSVYISLANSYKESVEVIEQISKKTVKNIIIVGGGSKDAYLNRLTALATGKTVYTGLMEATATGNITAQIMFDKKIDLAACREIIKKSFPIKEAK